MRTTSLILALLPLLAAAPLAHAQEEEETQQQQQQERPLPFRHLDPDETITVNFQNEDLGAILEMFSTNYELNLVYGPDVIGTVTMNFFNAPVQDALRQVLAANGFAYEVDGKFIVVKPLPTGGPEGQVTTSKFPPTVIFLDHRRATDLEPIVKPLLGPGETVIAGQESAAGIEISSDLGGNSEASQEMLVLFASEQTLERVRALLDQVDGPPSQVLVEATIMSVALTEDFQLGVDFSAFSGIDFQAMGGTTNVTDGLDLSPTGGNQLEDWLVGVQQREFTNDDAAGLHFGILRNQVGVFVNALENVSNATVLSNPQILTVNRHPAELLVGRKLPYITSNVTETGTLESVSFLEVGTSLVFRPFISSDGYVRMEVHPKKSDGFINQIGLPEETTTEVKTNIMIREGHTVVIGGLIETSMLTEVDQVPFLGSLPWIGQLFRQELQTESKSEIIVLLTPHIVSENDLSRRAKESRTRLNSARAQLAASHHGYLRPSYARRMYREAALALADGDPGKALAKAEWGLVAMPADPDLASLANHCRSEIRALRLEQKELEDAIELLRREMQEEEE